MMPTRLLRKFSKRRRPIARRAEFVNAFAEEDEDEDLQLCDFTVPIPSTFNRLPPKPRSRNIMQRLQHWLGDHLPGRKRRDSRRSDSETRQPISITGPLGSSTTRREPRMFGNLDGIPTLSMGEGGELRRRAIQTNPWFPLPSSDSSRIARTSDLLDASYSSSLSQLTRDESLRINTLAGSYTSSGYASQDSSPECSVHTPPWQLPSAQLVSAGRLIDKAVECRSLDLDAEMEELDQHIYHKLDSTLLHRLSAANDELDSCFSSDSNVVVCTASSSADSSRAESPIYAIPYCSSADESRCASIEYVDDSDGYMELTRRCRPEPPLHEPTPRFEYENGYACVRRPPSPKFHAPPPPSYSVPDQRSCLDLLDEQIAELKMKTEAVSRLVETAKERRELRDCARLMCLDQIERLRNMRWFVEHGFELQI
ncbi:hypothetical protein M3Y94_00773700 [Aphelenchoides besseyi]|nr:hypothetical protein M3Y94_00773700 [Aphelenchoides besseyi]KAI6232289.1 hypothetical protein M3Y95_00470500 [Aphelenchoides besseyi]